MYNIKTCIISVNTDKELVFQHVERLFSTLVIYTFEVMLECTLILGIKHNVVFITFYNSPILIDLLCS